MKRYITSTVLVLVTGALLIMYTPVYAQQNSETSARQAEIDADMAEAREEDLSREERARAGVEGVDAPAVQREKDQMQNLENEKIEAEQREEEAQQRTPTTSVRTR